MKLTPNQGGNGGHKPVIHVSLSLREDVKLNETENAWKPSRFKKDTISEEEYKTQVKKPVIHLQIIKTVNRRHCVGRMCKVVCLRYYY